MPITDPVIITAYDAIDRSARILTQVWWSALETMKLVATTEKTIQESLAVLQKTSIAGK
jgi:hypothetical protein